MMATQLGERPRADRDDTRARIKAVARNLFVEHGFDGVTTRQIMAAAGQRNVTLINYYFGSKAELVTELVRDALAVVDRDQDARLDALLARNPDPDMRELVSLFFVAPGDEDGTGTQHRFVAMLVLNHRQLLVEATGYQISPGSRRCLDELRKRMPGNDPEAVKTRLNLAFLLIIAGMAANEAAQAEPNDRRQSNAFAFTAPRGDIVDAVIAILMQD